MSRGKRRGGTCRANLFCPCEREWRERSSSANLRGKRRMSGRGGTGGKQRRRTTNEELAVKLDPVETQCVEERRQALHDTETADGRASASVRDRSVRRRQRTMRGKETHIAIVRVNHMANMKNVKGTARVPSMPNARSSVMFHRTSDSWACASERAHRRRYDAVLEMQPRQNSIVSARARA